MKHYEVIWVEIHSAFVDVEKIDDAIGEARSFHPDGTWDSFREYETVVTEVDELGDYIESEDA